MLPRTRSTTYTTRCFAAIDAHRKTAGKFQAENEKLAAAGIDGANWMPSQAALLAEVAAAKALIGTAPSTRAGVQALERHLREDSRLALYFIERTVTIDGCTSIASGTPEGVDWLIAKRAAEITRAV
jgi:hypothetical protein